MLQVRHRYVGICVQVIQILCSTQDLLAELVVRHLNSRGDGILKIV